MREPYDEKFVVQLAIGGADRCIPTYRPALLAIIHYRIALNLASYILAGKMYLPSHVEGRSQQEIKDYLYATASMAYSDHESRNKEKERYYEDTIDKLEAKVYRLEQRLKEKRSKKGR